MSVQESKLGDMNQKFFGTLSEQFYSQLNILRKSCNDFEGIQKKLSDLLNEENKNVIELITLMEFMNPSFSLDLMTLIVICSTVDHGC